MPNSETARPAPASAIEPRQIASQMVLRWLRIDASLSPIIGSGGVAALYHRSLHMTGRNHPWISRLRAGEDLKMDLTVLEQEIEKQPDDVGARAAAEFLATFHDLLTGLIGPSLSERLLGETFQPSRGLLQAKAPTP